MRTGISFSATAADLDRLRELVTEISRMSSSISFRPRRSRPSEGGQRSRRGGRIACDRNEEEGCYTLAATSRGRCFLARRRTQEDVGPMEVVRDVPSR